MPLFERYECQSCSQPFDNTPELDKHENCCIMAAAAQQTIPVIAYSNVNNVIQAELPKAIF